MGVRNPVVESVRSAGPGQVARAAVYVVVGLCYKALLDYSFLVPLQSETGGVFEYALSVDMAKMALSYVVTLALLLAVPKRPDAASLVYLFGLAYIVIPLGCVYGLTDQSTLFYLACSASFLLSELLYRGLRGLEFRFAGLGRGVVAAVGLFAAGVVAAMFVACGMPTLESLDLSSVYEVRAAFEAPAFLEKLLVPTAKAAFPFLLVVAFLRKRWTVCLAAFVGELLLFLWTGNKSWILILLVVLAVLVFYKGRRNIVVFAAFPVLVLACCVVLALSNGLGITLGEWPFSLFVRRAMYIPAFLKFAYFDFYSGRELQGFWGTFVAPFMRGEPPESWEHVIGQQYMGSYETYANTGMFGAEYAAFGLAGVFFAGLLFLFFALVVKVSSSKNGDAFALCLAVPLLITFSDASLLKTILSPLGAMTLALMMFFSLGERSPSAVGACRGEIFSPGSSWGGCGCAAVRRVSAGIRCRRGSARRERVMTLRDCIRFAATQWRLALACFVALTCAGFAYGLTYAPREDGLAESASVACGVALSDQSMGEAEYASRASNLGKWIPSIIAADSLYYDLAASSGAQEAFPDVDGASRAQLVRENVSYAFDSARGVVTVTAETDREGTAAVLADAALDVFESDVSQMEPEASFVRLSESVTPVDSSWSLATQTASFAVLGLVVGVLVAVLRVLLGGFVTWDSLAGCGSLRVFGPFAGERSSVREDGRGRMLAQSGLCSGGVSGFPAEAVLVPVGKTKPSGETVASWVVSALGEASRTTVLRDVVEIGRRVEESPDAEVVLVVQEGRTTHRQLDEALRALESCGVEPRAAALVALR